MPFIYTLSIPDPKFYFGSLHLRKRHNAWSTDRLKEPEPNKQGKSDSELSSPGAPSLYRREYVSDRIGRYVPSPGRLIVASEEGAMGIGTMVTNLEGATRLGAEQSEHAFSIRRGDEVERGYQCTSGHVSYW
jgi:hypothetical protein